MTTDLPARLRALADFITAHDLPEPKVTIADSSYGTLTLGSAADLARWAAALRTSITVRRVTPVEAPVFDAYTIEGVTIGGQSWRPAFHDLHVAAAA